MSWNMMPERYRSDVATMIERFTRATGKTINPLVAYTAWDEHSTMMAAGWLMVPDDDD